MYKVLILASALTLAISTASAKVIEESERPSAQLSIEDSLFDISEGNDLFAEALAAISRGDLGVARAQLALISQSNPNIPGRWELEGLLQLVEGKPADAEQALRKALELDDSISSVWSKLGAALIAQGKMAPGTDAHLRAVELDANNVFSLHMLARLAAASGDYQLAETRYRETVKRIGPSYTVAHRELTLLLLATDRADAAQKVMQPLQEGATEAAPLMLLARAQIDAGNKKQAIATLNDALQRFGDKPDTWRASTAMLMQLDNAGAMQAVEQGLKRFPDDPVLRFQLANAHELGGRRDEAVKIYRSLLDEASIGILARNNLALLLADDSATREEALTLANQAAEAAPDSPPIQDTLGWVLYRNGKASEGLPHLRNALAKLPGDPNIACHLAIVAAEVEGVDKNRAQLKTCAGSKADDKLVAAAGELAKS